MEGDEAAAIGTEQRTPIKQAITEDHATPCRRKGREREKEDGRGGDATGALRGVTSGVTQDSLLGQVKEGPSGAQQHGKNEGEHTCSSIASSTDAVEERRCR